MEGLVFGNQSLAFIGQKSNSSGVTKVVPDDHFLEYRLCFVEFLDFATSTNGCVFYILTSVWVLGTPNAGQNLHFQHFFC